MKKNELFIYLTVFTFLNITHTTNLKNDFSDLVIEILSENSYYPEFEIVDKVDGHWAVIALSVPETNYTINLLSNSTSSPALVEYTFNISYNEQFKYDFSNLEIQFIDSNGVATQMPYSVLYLSQGEWILISTKRPPNASEVVNFLATDNENLNLFDTKNLTNGNLSYNITTLIKDDPMFNVIMDSFGTDENNTLFVAFHHTEEQYLPVNLITDYDFNYVLSANSSKKDELVYLEVYNWSEDKYFEIKVGASSEIIGFGKVPEYDFDFEVLDAEGMKSVPEKRQNNVIIKKLKKGQQNLTIVPDNLPVREINFTGLTVTNSSSVSLFIDDPPETLPHPENKTWLEIYAIDLSNMDFSTATATIRAKGNSLYKCKDWVFQNRTCNGEWKLIRSDLIPGTDYNISLTPGDPGFGEANLTIINVQSFPAVGGNWTVNFTTQGTANLTITTINGTSWGGADGGVDLHFLELRCGNVLLDPIWDDLNKKVTYQNYSCNQNGSETSKVLTTGKHHLQFSFGGAIGYAHNDATNITDCAVIPASGEFQLINDINEAPNDASPHTGNACIKITASDVVLNCNGFNITSTTAGTTFGVLVTTALLVPSVPLTNITIQNCSFISNYTSGFYVYNSNTSIVSNTTLYNNSNGLVLDQSDFINISSVISYNNTENAFTLNSSSDNIISNTQVYNNTNYGFYLLSSHRNNITSSNSTNNTLDGIKLTYSNNTLIDPSYFCNNIGNGITINISDSTLIDNSIACNNTVYGIEIINSTNTIINLSEIYNNSYGIFMTNTNLSNFTNTNITNNSNTGVFFDNSSNTNNMSSTYICNNTVIDIQNLAIVNKGSLDRCDSFTNWLENGHFGCEYSCSSLWHRFFGNVDGNITLDDNGNGESVYQWVANGYNIYFADYDSVINWQELQAISLNTTNETSSNDFLELDTAFDTTAFTDNINNKYSNDGTNPKETQNYTLFLRQINYVPITNSTSFNTIFKTGILWDMADGGAEYNNDINQTTVWSVNINQSVNDTYGTYDYLIAIPYTLATREVGNNIISIYLELK